MPYLYTNSNSFLCTIIIILHTVCVLNDGNITYVYIHYTYICNYYLHVLKYLNLYIFTNFHIINTEHLKNG